MTHFRYAPVSSKTEPLFVKMQCLWDYSDFPISGEVFSSLKNSHFLNTAFTTLCYYRFCEDEVVSMTMVTTYEN